MLDFARRVAIITGAGQGLGRAYALMLAARNAAVVVNDVNRASAEAVVEEIRASGGQAVADTHDVGRSAAGVVKTAVDTFGHLDVVICNAGILRAGRFADQPEDEFWRVFDVSFRGVVDLSRKAWPHLAKSAAGRLILTSSSGVLANPGAAAYGAAKAAIWGLGNSLAAEGADDGIQVTTILPTAYTPMSEDAYSDPAIVATLREKMGPEHVAAFVAFLAHQDTTVGGDVFQVGGLHAGRIVLAGLPRSGVATGTPEMWATMQDELTADSDDLEQYRTTGDHSAPAITANNPALAPIFASMAANS